MKKSNVIILCVVFLVIGFTLGSFLKMVLNNNDNLNEVEEKKTVNYYENEEEKSNYMVDAEFNGKFWNYD